MTNLIHGRELLFVGDPVVLVLAHLRYPVYLLTILRSMEAAWSHRLTCAAFSSAREWAYAGTFFVYVMAAVSWAACGGGPGDLIGPLVFAMLTLASWVLRPPSRTLGVLFPAMTHA